MFGHDFETSLLRRVIALGQFPLFDRVDVQELAAVAQNAEEIELLPGDVLAAAGRDPAAAFLVVDGQVATPLSSWRARDVFGWHESLAHRAVAHDVRAIAPTRALRIDADDLIELLEDNFGVMRAALRVSAAALADGRPVVSRLAIASLQAPLGLVDRLVLLRGQPSYARARIRALAAIAHASEEMTWSAGSTIVHPGDPSPGSNVILGGEIDAGTSILTAGDSFGLLEMLAEVPIATALRARGPVRALTSSSAAIHDVLEDHAELGLAMLSSLSREILDRRERAASADAPSASAPGAGSAHAG